MDEPTDLTDAVERHYARGDLGRRILAILTASGIDQRSLTLEDLAPLDQFHLGGKRATLELIELAGIEAGWRVLDVGGGLGGSARLLAQRLRCQVTVLELTKEYMEVGAMLCERLDLANRVHYRCDDALAMPFEDARFDAAWTQHSTMNIADKDRLYEQLQRVLRQHGRLAMHEIVAGTGGEVFFPTPWADNAEQSFLLPQAQLRSLIARHGFTELAWQDVTEQAREWFARAAMLPAPPASLPQLGLHLLVSPEAMRQQLRNLKEERIQVVRAVFERP